MGVSLEDFDAELNSTSLVLLGDTITYTPFNGDPLTFKAIVDYSDEIERLSNSQAIRGDCAVEVPISAVAQPDGRDVVTLPRTNLDYHPKHFIRDETGQNWLIVLKRKP